MAGVVENDRVARQIAELPIKDVVGTCVDVLFGDGDGDDGDDVIVQAPPGAGKTTALPVSVGVFTLGKSGQRHHRSFTNQRAGSSLWWSRDAWQRERRRREWRRF